MKCFLGIGSNLGDRLANLERAAQILTESIPLLQLLQVSPVVESPALVLGSAPEDWRKPFLNAVIEIEFRGSPQELLKIVKGVEMQMGREASPRWSPRIIDIDILTFGDQVIGCSNETQELTIPHPEMWNRQFVLTPLKYLAPSLVIPGPTNPQQQTVLMRSRSLSSPLPLWMGILNVTPDSFSESQPHSTELFQKKIEDFKSEDTAIYDLGAESTRPGALPLTSEQECQRLAEPLETLLKQNQRTHFSPIVSIDTYHAATAMQALEIGAGMINDVGGLRDPEMLKLLARSDCQYVLMHSLSVPADPQVVLSDEDVMSVILEWASEKLQVLASAGVSLNRVFFDPGIGFGKTPSQSWALLRQMDRLLELPVRLLVGHSKKSFLKNGSQREAHERDFETLGVSLALAEKGVDVLRVHNPAEHQRTLRTFRELNTSRNS